MPGFYLRGKPKISSSIGGLLTLVMIGVLLLYATVKAKELLSRSNPNISSFEEEMVLGSEDTVNLDEAGIRFAWSFEGYVDR